MHAACMHALHTILNSCPAVVARQNSGDSALPLVEMLEREGQKPVLFFRLTRKYQAQKKEKRTPWFDGWFFLW